MVQGSRLGNNDKREILRVYRSRKSAKRAYDLLSNFYGIISEPFENKVNYAALGKLRLKKGEKVLEIGFGTGYVLEKIIERIGINGKAYGIDISSGMLDVALRRLKKRGLERRVNLVIGDALRMPYQDRMFDAVFIGFTLELFDTPEIPKVLLEISRVLKKGGRLCVVSISKEENNLMVGIYEWFHKHFESIADCRPIYAKESIKAAGYRILSYDTLNLSGLPCEIVIAENKSGVVHDKGR